METAVAAIDEAERALVLRARDGDRGAFGSLVQLHMRRAYFAALGLVGSEADAIAMRVARAFTGREKILKFEGGYHGGVITFAGHRDVNVPHDWIVSTYNDVAATEAVFAEHGGSIAAVKSSISSSSVCISCWYIRP